MKYNNKDVLRLGTILGIWAHPDDEAFACSGLIAAAIANGQRVVLITATNGDAGESSDEERWPTKDLGKIRNQELIKSLRIIGNIEHHSLGYKDGELCNIEEKEALEQIAAIAKIVRPDTVVSFEKGGVTGHEDHKTVHRWSKALVNNSSVQCELLFACENAENYELNGRKLDEKFNIYFNCDTPRLVSQSRADVCFELDDSLMQKKLDCIKAHESQTWGMFNNKDSVKLISEMARVECFIKDT